MRSSLASMSYPSSVWRKQPEILAWPHFESRDKGKTSQPIHFLIKGLKMHLPADQAHFHHTLTLITCWHCCVVRVKSHVAVGSSSEVACELQQQLLPQISTLLSFLRYNLSPVLLLQSQVSHANREWHLQGFSSTSPNTYPSRCLLTLPLSKFRRGWYQM